MKIEVLLPEGIKNFPKNFILDIKGIFSKNFIKERWHLHAILSTVISIGTLLLLRTVTNLEDTPLLFQSFVIGGGISFAANFAREFYYELKYGAFFDWRDIRVGTYFGILSTTILLTFL